MWTWQDWKDALLEKQDATFFCLNELQTSLSVIPWFLWSTGWISLPASEPGSCISHHSLFTIKQISAQTCWHTLCLEFTTRLKNPTSPFSTTVLTSQFLLVCYSNSSQHCTLRKAQALVPHCNCKDHLIKHPFLSPVTFFPWPSTSYLTSTDPFLLLSTATTLILDQQEDWGRTYFPCLSDVKR